MNHRSSVVFQDPIGGACTYLVWLKVLFEFKLGQFEGKVPDESSVRGLGRERDFFTRRVSTGVAAIYCVAKEGACEPSGNRIGEALARTWSTRKSGAPEAIVLFRSSYEEQNRMSRSKSVSENEVRTGGWEIVHFVRPRTEV